MYRPPSRTLRQPMKRDEDQSKHDDSVRSKESLDSPKKGIVEPSKLVEPKAVEKVSQESPKENVKKVEEKTPKLVKKVTEEPQKPTKIEVEKPKPVQNVTEERPSKVNDAVKPKLIVKPKLVESSKTMELHPKSSVDPFKKVIPKKEELPAKAKKDLKEEVIHQPLTVQEEPEKVGCKKKLLAALTKVEIQPKISTENQIEIPKKICDEKKKEIPPQKTNDGKAVKLPKKISDEKNVAIQVKCSTSILESFKIGDIFECVPEEAVTAAMFNAIIVDENILEYVMNGIPKEVEKVRKSNVSIGDFVVVPGQDGTCARHLVLSSDELIEVLDIDMAKVSKVKKEEVHAMSIKAKDLPALGCRAFGQGKMPVALCTMIEEVIAEIGSFKAKVVGIIMKKDRFKCIEVTLLDTNDKPITNYIIYPWTCLDSRIAKAIGLPEDRVLIGDLENTLVKIGDSVIKVDFGPTSNGLIVWRVDDFHLESDLAQIMDTEGQKQPSIRLDDLVNGQIVTCQWCEDDQYYRAVVTDINKTKMKVKVRFVDYGNISVEDEKRIKLVPDLALKFPILAKLLKLQDVPDKATKEIDVCNRLKQLQPLLESELTAKEVQTVNGQKMWVLQHPNGKTINKIIKEKLSEAFDGPAPEVQGSELGGQINYDKVHVATLVSDQPELEQEVTVMFADSPVRIFVCPNNQIGLAAKITEQVLTYCAIDETMVGFGPQIGKVCLAKSMDDDSWYRGACIGHGDKDLFEIFFVDYGFKELLPRTRLKMIDPILMETVFLASHCILDGFDNAEKGPEYDKNYGQIVAELLEFMTETKVKVLKQVHDGYYIIQIANLDKIVAEEKAKNKANESTMSQEDKEDKIRKLHEELAKLTKMA